MKKIITTLLISGTLSCFLLSCNDKKERTKENNKTEVLKSNNLEVIIDAKFKKNDLIRLYYMEENDKEFSIQKSITKNVYADDSFQIYDFVIPTSVKIKDIQIQLTELRQEEAVIKNITFKRGENKIDGSDGAYLKYFISNESINYNQDDYTFKFKTKNNVFLNSTDELKKSLNSL